MQTLPNATESTRKSEQHLPWHKPEIERLTISMDTGNTIGSATDASTLGFEIIQE